MFDLHDKANTVDRRTRKAAARGKKLSKAFVDNRASINQLCRTCRIFKWRGKAMLSTELEASAERTGNPHRDVVVLSFTYLCLFMAYSGLQSIVTTLQEDMSAGYYSMSTIYLFMLISAPFSVDVLHTIGSRWSLLLAISGYWAYVAVNAATSHLVPLILVSVYQGSCAGLLWVTQAIYLANAANRHAAATGSCLASVLGSFSGMFWGIFAANQVLGNALTFVICHLTASSSPASPPAASPLPLSMGNRTEAEPSDTQSFTPLTKAVLMSAFLSCLFLATALAASLPPARKLGPVPTAEDACKDDTGAPSDSSLPVAAVAGVSESHLRRRLAGSSPEEAQWLREPLLTTDPPPASHLLPPASLPSASPAGDLLPADAVVHVLPAASSMRCRAPLSFWQLMLEPRLVALIPVIFYSGFQSAFMSGDFTHRVVLPSLGVAWIGGAMSAFGLAQVATGTVTSLVGGSPASITAFLLLGVACQAAAQAFLLAFLPGHLSLGAVLALAVLWGVAESVLFSQLNAAIPFILQGDSDAALAHWQVWCALGYSLMFALEPQLQLRVKLAMLMVCCLACAPLSLVLYGFARAQQGLA